MLIYLEIYVFVQMSIYVLICCHDSLKSYEINYCKTALNRIFYLKISKIRVLNNKKMLIFQLLNFADFSLTFAYFLIYLLPAPFQLRGKRLSRLGEMEETGQLMEWMWVAGTNTFLRYTYLPICMLKGRIIHLSRPSTGLPVPSPPHPHGASENIKLLSLPKLLSIVNIYNVFSFFCQVTAV